MKSRHVLIALVAVLLLPLAAAAQDARTTKAVNLRAGPARDYPLVASFGPGTPLAVQGCTDGYAWCDVIGPADVRGWVYAGNLVYPYQSSEVPVLGYGPTLGFPIVGFSLGDYWGSYYRDRPWFGNQGRWMHHRPPVPPRVGFRPPGLPRPIGRPATPFHPPYGRRGDPADFHPAPGFRPPEGRPSGGRPGGERRSMEGGRPGGEGRSMQGGRPGGGEPGRGGQPHEGGEQRPSH